MAPRALAAGPDEPTFVARPHRLPQLRGFVIDAVLGHPSPLLGPGASAAQTRAGVGQA